MMTCIPPPPHMRAAMQTQSLGDAAAGPQCLKAPVQRKRSTEELVPGEKNIRVSVRVRPLPANEEGIIEVEDEGVILIHKEAATGGNQFLKSQKGRTEERQFDRVFGPHATQAEVYQWVGAPLIWPVVCDGRNATIFVYGATGAGKTHTMFGESYEESQQGIIYRVIADLFHALDVREQMGLKPSLSCRVSLLELYNENVRDLLAPDCPDKICRVLEDEKKGMVKVSNLREVPVENTDEALRILRAGMNARKVEATAANSRSSRSHAMLSLQLDYVERVQRRPGTLKNCGQEVRRPHARLCLIDLAGSERAQQTQNVGSALKDGAKINQSLLALANCIDALTHKKKDESASLLRQPATKKAPYRDSKLTLLLKSSLVGDGLVSMVANVHPGRTHFEDSNNTLEYAKRAQVVKLRTVIRPTRLSTTQPTSPLVSPEASSFSSPVQANGRSKRRSTSAPNSPVHELVESAAKSLELVVQRQEHLESPRLDVACNFEVEGRLCVDLDASSPRVSSDEQSVCVFESASQSDHENMIHSPLELSHLDVEEAVRQSLGGDGAAGSARKKMGFPDLSQRSPQSKVGSNDASKTVEVSNAQAGRMMTVLAGVVESLKHENSTLCERQRALQNEVEELRKANRLKDDALANLARELAVALGRAEVAPR